MTTKRFSIRTILTVTTDRLLTVGKGPKNNGIGDLYEILNWMTSDNLFTHQLGRASKECKPWLLMWFPELEAANSLDRQAELDELLKDAGTDRQKVTNAIDLWCGVLFAGGVKLYYDVPKIPEDDHIRKNPFDELIEMRGTDEGIVLVDPETGKVDAR